MQLRTTNATHKTVFICRSVPTSLDILVSSSCILLFQVAPVFDPKDKSLTLELMEISDFSAGCRTPFYSVELWRVIQQPGIALPKDFGSTEYFGKDQHCENPNPDLLSRYISNYVICISLVWYQRWLLQALYISDLKTVFLWYHQLYFCYRHGQPRRAWGWQQEWEVQEGEQARAEVCWSLS